MRTVPDHIGDRVSVRAGIVNLPNGLTFLRLLFVPVFAWLLLDQGGQNPRYRFAATVVFLLASVTDLVDGYLARKLDLVTTFGKVADPLADKALTGTALIGLSLIGSLSWWITAVILIRELGVTIVRFLVIRHGVIPASRGGKSKTVAQMIAISLFLLPGLKSGFWFWFKWLWMGLAVVLTVLTGIDYLDKAREVRRAGHRRRAMALAAADADDAASGTDQPIDRDQIQPRWENDGTS
jgi:CDP-diacylglycerol--glycerol-3-phosphate 3-phosphatidyltransferase